MEYITREEMASILEAKGFDMETDHVEYLAENYGFIEIEEDLYKPINEVSSKLAKKVWYKRIKGIDNYYNRK